MLANRASDRSYSTSIASSARETSRMAYQTVAKIMKHAAAVAITNPDWSAQRGWRPVSGGTVNCMPTHRAAPTVTIELASARCSVPSTNTVSDADTR